MLQWQYCYVSHRGNEAGYLTHYTERGTAVCPIHPDAPAGDQDGADARARLIWQLGREGWELVAVLRVEDEYLPPGATWYFKRPCDTPQGAEGA